MVFLCIIIYSSLVSQCEFKIIKQLDKKFSMSTGTRTVLMTTEVGSRTPLLFDLESTTFVVDNAAKKSVCNDSGLLIGPLIDSNVSLDTTNGNRGISLKTGNIRIA